MAAVALHTRRLCLRPVAAADAPALAAAASAREIADTMISLPHPVPQDHAEEMIAAWQYEFAAGQGIARAITAAADGAFLGIAEIRSVDVEHAQAELSFWLAKAAWGHGYMREVVPALVHHAFADLGLNRIYAYHMTRNPASARVLAAAGFQQEGLLRQRVRKWGVFEDVALWALLAGDAEDVAPEGVLP